MLKQGKIKPKIGLIKRVFQFFDGWDGPSKCTFIFNLSQLVVSIIGLFGIFWIANALASFPSFQSEYEYSLSVSPESILLNQSNPIDLKITLTNTGIKDIPEFRVYEIKVCRIEQGNNICKQILAPSSAGSIKCDLSNTNRDSYDTFVFLKGETCVLNLKFFPDKMFDDKDKPVKVYIFTGSIPPLGEKQYTFSIE